MKRKIVFRENFQGPESNIVDYLHSKTGLSKSLIKKLMLRGAVWLTHKKRDRVRRAKKTLYPGNRIELFYDPKIEPKDLKVQIIKKGKDWSIWYKPAGMLTQGTDYGDEGTLLRQVEQEQGLSYLVHRLDSQTSGLVLFAHSKRKAAEISKALQNNEIKKFYQAEVLGHPHEQTIDLPLDGKEAQTKILSVTSKDLNSLLELEIITGRTHQIRRHLEAIGHPVIGDPKYGQNNKNTEGMKLVAHKLIWNAQEYALLSEFKLF